jgi:catechol 2,3-dioxygenase-like lactoylglutathione lyase family enzyme
MLDHISIAVSDHKASKQFYSKALEPLGFKVLMDFPETEPGHAGFGVPPKPEFWIAAGAPGVSPVHVAFLAPSRAKVDAFYTAAIAAGGRDNGPPGLRRHYHPNYYAAFVLDPDGHNIEAVCHLPE